jgi:tetratricopeptide (TPR) repeat protein
VTKTDLEVQGTIQHLRLARRKGDKKAMGNLLDSLLQQPIDDIDAASEVIVVLQNMGRKNDASRLFQETYDAYERQLATEADNPEFLNNVAWLCAYSGQRPDEAVQLAEKAIATDKDNPAFIDTAAEAHMRAGNYARAVELETRALELRPGDPFMTRQLKKFQALNSKK